MIVDTLIFIVIWSFLILGFCSFITMIDELLFGGVISDRLEWFFDKVAELYWCIAGKVRRKK